MKNSVINQLIKQPFYSLAALWLLVQTLLYMRFGIITVDEAKKYLDEADYFMATGSFSIPKNLFYSMYVLLVAGMKMLGAGITGVYLVQLFINGISTYFFYRLARLYSAPADSLTAYLATFLLIICIPYQAWTTHLYTESLFTSLLILFLYAYAGKGLLSLQAIILLAMVILARPTGILLVPALLLSYFVHLISDKKLSPLSIGAILTGMLFSYFVINHAMKGKGDFDFMLPFTQGHIICDVPGVKVPSTLQLPENPNSLNGMLYFILHNPVYFGELAIKKLWYFLSLQRPYYSALHNLALGAFFYPLYLLAGYGFIRFRKKNSRQSTWLACYCMMFTFTVMLTCDDWLNRFILPVLPVLMLMAGYALSTFIQQTKERIRN
ncbi:glycosyltransferase family 39 protein [Flavihumibacter rivuli]|uniref:glycosyltransferase family 39 protein n=1 Tax=Flavihumibacter rivuli TaxID=2838156 RepID=UPI001BDEA8D1|nr:glycosyltransferase family 39 protein [Flavihumibacter rivuli]ULQ58160.1 glycosyltransferase family 39 protein [Flavihumibacter rivuli]